MIYIHYEQFKLADVDAIKLVFSSSKTSPSIIIGQSDWNKVKELSNIFKQIPSGKRSYDPIVKMWILPESILKVLLVMPDLGKTAHNDLDAWLNPPKNQDNFKWYDNANIKAEAPEDFFHAHTASSSCVLTETELQAKLLSIVKPFMKMPEDDNLNKEWFLRAYKITARKLHPDLGGDANKMSELNMLWNQYKEIAR